MKYENGFYIYTPNEAKDSHNKYMGHPFSYHQVIEVVDNYILVTGFKHEFDLSCAESEGTIGKMVMNDKGEVL